MRSVLMPSLLLLLASCAPTYNYTMLAPQVSESNRYVGSHVEVQVRFGSDRLGLSIINTSEGDVSVDWGACSFITPSGKAVRLIPVGDPPVNKVPRGSRIDAIFTLSRWDHPKPRLWHRRESLKRRLVYTNQVSPGVPAMVKLHLAMGLWEVNDRGDIQRREEVLSMQFAVQDPKDLKTGGKRR